MNEREKEVLKIIMKHYLSSGESVGSRTLEKKYNMGVSSATIRNVMSDLETMGLITKTHTSSGRIPTLNGYKLYIDEILEVEAIDEDLKEQIFNVYKNRLNKSDTIFYETAKLLSEITSSMAVVLEPSSQGEVIKKVNFIRITNKDVFVVVVMKNNIVKTCMLTMNTYINEENVENLNDYMKNLLNSTHKGFMLKDLERFLKTIGKTDLNYDDKKIFENNKIFIEGRENVIFKDMLDINQTIDLIKTVNDDNLLKNIFRNLAENINYETNKPVIVFGEELDYKELEDYVFIYGIYEFGDEKGIIGIMSQTRIDYSKILATIEIVINMMKKMLNQNIENLYLGYFD